MNASRARGAALIAALSLVGALLLLAPPMRPYVRSVAYALGIRHPAVPLTEGRPLGRVTVSALDGSPVELQARSGRALLINVFATWCVPCREETPLLTQTAPALRKAGIDVAGVDQGDPPQSVEAFARAYGLAYPTYVDGDRTSTITLAARVIPTTVLADRTGVVRSIHVGPLDRSDLIAMAQGRQ